MTGDRPLVGPRLVRTARRLGVALLLLYTAAWLVTRATRGPTRAVPEVQGHADAAYVADHLTVMTLNLAHGRSTGFHQLFTSTQRLRDNLEAVAAVMNREGPDVVAVQEADGPSAWSGRFDHVEYVADAAGYPVHLRGDHVLGPRLRYGTALISRYALHDPLSVTFPPTPPTFSKGFVVARVDHPHWPDGLDIVSIHLDFARSRVRGAQIDRLIEVLRERRRPVFIMGDFNMSWKNGNDLQRLADTLALESFEPEAKLITFPTTGKRLDWILVPRELEIEEYRVLDDVVSDHRGVVARIRVR
ncbi:MAG: endonuclease/exonuclease/phosphatase family protein [bacterium]